MLSPSLISTTLFILLLPVTSLVQASSILEGSLATTEDKPWPKFTYSTQDPFETNWIGIYKAGKGPINQETVPPPQTWGYAPGAKGTINLEIEDFIPGEYVVYFLARDGFKWLANPLNITLKPDPTTRPVSFVTKHITLHNGRQGDIYKATVAGLTTGNSPNITYHKVSGDGWVQVSADGIISGIPRSNRYKRAYTAVITIRALSSDKSSSDLKVSIPVRSPGVPLVSQLRVMSFNLWNGGVHVLNYREKQARFLAESNVDIVSLQEASGGHTKRLADAFGWSYWESSSGDVGILSRYPIVAKYGAVNSSAGIRIALGESEVNFWGMHLGYKPYGPHDFCVKKMSVEQVLKHEEESGRTPQIEGILNAMSSQLAEADKVPVIMAGDTNAPSHLDWTERSRHCGYGDVPWPTSVKPKEAGLVDSFRAVHPDPVTVPGNTWSPLYPAGFNNTAIGMPEPQDRIDFIYHKGGLAVLDSKTLVVGNPKPEGSHRENEWTSDHAALLTVYDLCV
ncbi:hypothetical protein ABW20_dc0102647 [Dactylellina cionopaga]|nr:hypothetical protein ABW20_dc0102647 [Dactylellina cionopaga]